MAGNNRNSKNQQKLAQSAQSPKNKPFSDVSSVTLPGHDKSGTVPVPRPTSAKGNRPLVSDTSITTATTGEKIAPGLESMQVSPTSTVQGDPEISYAYFKGEIDLTAVINTTIDIVQGAFKALSMQATRLSDLGPALEAEEQVSSLN